MNRILLVDDSPHAQRIGERILTDEDFEVVTVSNAESALIRLDDAEPDVVIAKAVMPGRSGYEICRFIKMSPRHQHVRVVLTAGAMETLDQDEVERSGADGTLRKPFEATALLEKVRPLAEAAAAEKAAAANPTAMVPSSTLVANATPQRAPEPKITAPVIAVIDPEQVRAAVTVAIDASMEALVEAVTQRVLAILTSKRQPERGGAAPAGESADEEPVAEAPAEGEPVRAVHRAVNQLAPAQRAYRPRSGSILGLYLSDPEAPAAPEEPTESE